MPIPATGFKGINQYLKVFFTDKQPKDCLVVIDIDEVLTRLASPIYEADPGRAFEFTARINALDLKLQEMVYSRLYDQGSVATDPDGIKAFFLLLRNKGIPHICLTSFRCPTFGFIKNSHLRRDRELKDLGIDLTDSYHFTADDTLEEFNEPQPRVRFFRSIVFTEIDKGQALLFFLEKTAKPKQFTHIIAIDDQIRNLQAIQSTFPHNITLFLYKAPALRTSKQSPDSERLSEELEGIIKDSTEAPVVCDGSPLPVKTSGASM